MTVYTSEYVARFYYLLTLLGIYGRGVKIYSEREREREREMDLGDRNPKSEL